MPDHSVYELLNKKRRGGPLEPREIEFYQHIGFAIDDVVSLGKRLEKD